MAPQHKRRRRTVRPASLNELPALSRLPLPASIAPNTEISVRLRWLPSLQGLPSTISTQIFAYLDTKSQGALALSHRRLLKIFREPELPHYLKFSSPADSMSAKLEHLDAILSGTHASPMDLIFLDSDSFVAGKVNSDRLAFWDRVTKASPDKRDEVMGWMTDGIRVEKYMVPSCGKLSLI